MESKIIEKTDIKRNSLIHKSPFDDQYFFNSNLFQEELIYTKKFLEKNNDNSEGYLKKSKLYCLSGNYKKAVDIINIGLKWIKNVDYEGKQILESFLLEIEKIKKRKIKILEDFKNFEFKKVFIDLKWIHANTIYDKELFEVYLYLICYFERSSEMNIKSMLMQYKNVNFLYYYYKSFIKLYQLDFNSSLKILDKAKNKFPENQKIINQIQKIKKLEKNYNIGENLMKSNFNKALIHYNNFILEENDFDYIKFKYIFYSKICDIYIELKNYNLALHYINFAIKNYDVNNKLLEKKIYILSIWKHPKYKDKINNLKQKIEFNENIIKKNEIYLNNIVKRKNKNKEKKENKLNFCEDLYLEIKKIKNNKDLNNRFKNEIENKEKNRCGNEIENKEKLKFENGLNDIKNKSFDKEKINFDSNRDYD